MNQFLIHGFNHLSRRKILISLPNQSQIDCNVHGPSQTSKSRTGFIDLKHKPRSYCNQVQYFHP